MNGRLLPLAILPIQLLLSASFLPPLAPGRLEAQEVSVRAHLNQHSVGVGRAFVLNLEVSGSQNLDREPELPDLSTFATYLGSGTSSSVQIVNGRTTVSLTIQLRYQALEEGAFQIPSVQLSVGGQPYATEPIEITVSSAPSPAEGGAGATGDPGEVAAEDLFLTAEVSRPRVREGEPFIVEYRIFTRVDVSGYSFTRIPEHQGFWAEELSLPDPPQVEQVLRNGVQYTSAAIRRVALVPTGSGERTLGPLGIEAQVRTRGRNPDPFESIFDRRSIFPSVMPASVLSPAIDLEVEPLPAGRPEAFSGVVGNLRLTATLDHDSVGANEAVTFRVRAEGEGNLRAIPEPTLNLPGDFEIYPPEVSETVRPSGAGLGGNKTWEYVVIPRAPGSRTLPPVSFSYFDTREGAYRIAATDPLILEVSGEILEGPVALVRGGVATLREDIRFIHTGPSDLSPTHSSGFKGMTFWGTLLLPLAAILGALVLRAHQNRMQGDPAYARRRRAGRVAHARLGRARRLAGKGQAKQFYAEAAQALRGFVADKLDVAEAGMQMREATEGLGRLGVPSHLIEELSACLDLCDRQRFAPPGRDAGEEARLLERIGRVMTDLNREVRG